MINNGINPNSTAPRAARFVARSRTSAEQWALHIDRTTPPVVTSWAAFRRELLSARGDAVLTPLQVRTLWQRIIAESDWSEQLLDARSVAAWAAGAWSLCRNYEIDLAAFPSRSREMQVLKEWAAAYDATLASRAWIDPGHFIDRLNDDAALGPPLNLRLLDVERTPAEARCLQRLEPKGWRFEDVALPRVDSRIFAHSAENAESELETAVDWVCGRAAQVTAARIALVVPSSYATGTSLEREFANSGVPIGFAHERSAQRLPPVAAALAAIELFTPRGNLRTFSTWLRSPFFHGHSVERGAAAARIEVELRGSLYVQLDFATAFRDAGFDDFIRRHDSALADTLHRAIEIILDADRPMSPTKWTELWQTCLRTLGWMAAASSGREASIQALDSIFSDVSRLTPILGTVSQAEAFDALKTIAKESTLPSRMPATGIHVLEHIDDVGPGFDAVWALGLSDAAWPERRSPNPLLPRSLQIEFDLPYARPGDAVSRARESLERLRHTAPEVVVSWPRRDEDAPRHATSVIDHWTMSSLAPAAARRGRPDVRIGNAAPELETLVDKPMPLSGSRIRGGAGMLNAQAHCPLRAYLEFRLDARPLERWGRGVSPRLRGIMLHRAADRLLPPGTRSSAFDETPPADWGDRIVDVAESILREHFGAASGPLLYLFMLERRRFVRVLERLVEAESGRGAFEVTAVERASTIRIDKWEIQSRLDRLDRLSGGRVAIIDYKTGRQNQAPQWSGPSIGDLQLPLYTLAVTQPLTAAVLCGLGPEEVRYRGYWENADEFPGRPDKLQDGRTWPEQLDHWAALIASLVAEFAAGDVRIRVAGIEALGALYAPLSRIYEQLALHKSSRK